MLCCQTHSGLRACIRPLKRVNDGRHEADLLRMAADRPPAGLAGGPGAGAAAAGATWKIVCDTCMT